MLGTRNAVANLAVSDLGRARAFYTGTLGLKQVDNEGEELIVLESGDSLVNVYRSEYAGTNEATAVTWQVDDIEAEVAGVRARGVTFEHYDMPGLALEGDVHVGESMKVAWFKGRTATSSISSKNKVGQGPSPKGRVVKLFSPFLSC